MSVIKSRTVQDTDGSKSSMIVGVEIRTWWACPHAFHSGVVCVGASWTDTYALISCWVQIRWDFNGTFVHTTFGVRLGDLSIGAWGGQHTFASIIISKPSACAEVVALPGVRIGEHVGEHRTISHAGGCHIIGVPVPLLKTVGLAHSCPILCEVVSGACLLAGIVDCLSVIASRAHRYTIPSCIISECSLWTEICASFGRVVSILISCAWSLALWRKDISIRMIGQRRTLGHTRPSYILCKVICWSHHRAR